jgi:hypothetical protein
MGIDRRYNDDYTDSRHPYDEPRPYDERERLVRLHPLSIHNVLCRDILCKITCLLENSIFREAKTIYRIRY